MDAKLAFADRLRLALDRQGIARVDAERKRYLAKIADITPRHAGKYLSGEKLPCAEGMITLSQQLGVSPAWLIAGIALHGMCYTLYFITGQLFLDRRVEPGMRSQAQGLLTLASNGVGSVVGTLIARQLYDFTVGGQHGGWATYWWIQAACTAVCVPVLWIFYQGVAAGKR
jgi:MFS family permease